MIAVWMVYSAAVALLLGLAARASEAGLRPHRLPVRGVWAAALAGSTLLPGAVLLGWRSSGVIGWLRENLGERLGLHLGPLLPAPGPAGSEDGSGLASGASTLIAHLSSLDGPLLITWAGCSAALLAALGLAALRLRRERATWEMAELDGVPVRVSPDRGPAVLGLGRARIVVPRWVLSLEAPAQRLILRHELEHIRGRDPFLLAAGLALVALAPWNPGIWWQLRRLEQAVEIDCDRRVLSGGTGPGEYGELLLRIADRLRRTRLPVPALAEGSEDLRRRIETMSERKPKTALRAGAGMLASAALLAAACEVPSPSEAPLETQRAESGREVPAAEDPDPATATATAAERPSFIPYDTPPRLRNAEEVMQALRDEYPAELKAAGVGGPVELWLMIDREGQVAARQVKTTSGVQELDAAAVSVAEVMRFDPARHEGEPTDVWVSQWITFEVREDGGPDS